ncbi:BTAD domain-containing putative transcriptional regulator [Streptomyces sp. NPDC056401]|uniref:AfsR/SARP family transcriptional regulator n=1 Tax=Streptomyces sp. NPDC056401 TaxID=3345809 RepID=UPI0035DB29BF
MEARFGLLGELTLHLAGEPRKIPGPKAGLLLAALLLRPNELLTAEQLATTLWGERRPRTAAASLHNHLARLRSALGPERDRLRAARGAYALEVRPGELDTERFGALLRRAQDAYRAGEWGTVERESSGARALWRGRPLLEFPSLQESPEVSHLVELHLQAAELHCEARLQQGRYDGLATELLALTAEFPLHETFHRQLMLALHRSNRQGEALSVFHRLRRTLAEELGVDPGSGVQEALQEILGEGRGRPKAAPESSLEDSVSASPEVAARPMPATARPLNVPAQLPPADYGFCGRQAELRRLEGIRQDACQRPGTVTVIALSGTGGVGKTALAVQWAHGVRGHFPDGQLYLNLRGFCPSGPEVTPMDALRHLLDGLGVPHARIPATRDARTALLRTLTDGRRFLILLDNARNAEQVRPLLPGTSSSLVLVTSRDQLVGLVAVGGAHPVPLDLLSVEDARGLLTTRIGEDRARAEPAELDEIIELTARLPLALAVVAARAAVRPTLTMAELVGRLKIARGLDAFTGHDVFSNVRAVLSWSYETLTPEAARLFRLLAVHPGPGITAAAAASLSGRDQPQVIELLDEITQAHLIVQDADGRYAFHDLLRAYATEIGGLVDSRATRSAALGRQMAHYLYTAERGARLMDPQLVPLELPPSAPRLVRPDRLPGMAEAREWFTAEHAVLLSIIGQAAAEGLDRICWQLAYVIKTYLCWCEHWSDWRVTQTSALHAAQRMGDLAAQAHAHRSLGHAYSRSGRDDEAQAHLASALDLFAVLGDPVGQGDTELDIAAWHERRGSAEEALRHNELALEFFRVSGQRGAEAKALNNVGYFLTLLGDHARALAMCEQACRVFEELGDRRSLALTWDSLGLVHHGTGDHEQAIACYRHAIEGHREVGSRYSEAESLDHLGDTQLVAGEPHAAHESWRRAVELLEALDHDDADIVRAKLPAAIERICRSV